jgi:hypothetical protein
VSDTPKTDRVLKNCNGWHHVPIEFAREQELYISKLELELAEAKDWCNAADDLDRQLTAHKAALEKCEKVLDGEGKELLVLGHASVKEALAAIKQLKQQ